MEETIRKILFDLLDPLSKTGLIVGIVFLVSFFWGVFRGIDLAYQYQGITPNCPNEKRIPTPLMVLMRLIFFALGCLGCILTIPRIIVAYSPHISQADFQAMIAAEGFLMLWIFVFTTVNIPIALVELLIHWRKGVRPL